MMILPAVLLFCGLYPIHSYPCYHGERGPSDTMLSCDSSSLQILSESESQTQKQNLIIFDIDATILDSQIGYHGPLFWKHARYGDVNAFKPHPEKDMVLMFLSEPREYSIIFRRHFFDFLDYVYKDSGFSSDLVIYHNGTPIYIYSLFIFNKCFQRCTNMRIRREMNMCPISCTPSTHFTAWIIAKALKTTAIMAYSKQLYPARPQALERRFQHWHM